MVPVRTFAGGEGAHILPHQIPSASGSRKREHPLCRFTPYLLFIHLHARNLLFLPPLITSSPKPLHLNPSPPHLSTFTLSPPLISSPSSLPPTFSPHPLSIFTSFPLHLPSHFLFSPSPIEGALRGESHGVPGGSSGGDRESKEDSMLANPAEPSPCVPEEPG